VVQRAAVLRLNIPAVLLECGRIHSEQGRNLMHVRLVAGDGLATLDHVLCEWSAFRHRCWSWSSSTTTNAVSSCEHHVTFPWLDSR
jgi:hypothetical protein